MCAAEKECRIRSKYVHGGGYKSSTVSFLLQRVFDQLKRETIQGIARCNCGFHSVKHWSYSPASTKSIGINCVLRLIFQDTDLHQLTMQNKRISACLLCPWLSLLLYRCFPGLQEIFFSDIFQLQSWIKRGFLQYFYAAKQNKLIKVSGKISTEPCPSQKNRMLNPQLLRKTWSSCNSQLSPDYLNYFLEEAFLHPVLFLFE